MLLGQQPHGRPGNAGGGSDPHRVRTLSRYGLCSLPSASARTTRPSDCRLLLISTPSRARSPVAAPPSSRHAPVSVLQRGHFNAGMCFNAGAGLGRPTATRMRTLGPGQALRSSQVHKVEARHELGGWLGAVQ